MSLTPRLNSHRFSGRRKVLLASRMPLKVTSVAVLVYGMSFSCTQLQPSPEWASATPAVQAASSESPSVTRIAPPIFTATPAPVSTQLLDSGISRLDAGLYLVASDEQGLVVHNLDGARLGTLAQGWFGNPSLHLPTWRIVHAPASGALEVLDLETLRETTVARDTWALDTSWSPDGTMVSVETLSPDEVSPSIGIVSLETGDYRRIDAWPGTSHKDEHPVWSPDGKWIAFTTDHFRERQADLVLIDTACLSDAGDCADSVRRIPTRADGPEFYDPSWSPDSSELVAGCSTFDGTTVQNSLCAIGAQSGSVRHILDDPVQFPSPSKPLWSPDGSYVAFQQLLYIYVVDVNTGEVISEFDAVDEMLEFWLVIPSL